MANQIEFKISKTSADALVVTPWLDEIAFPDLVHGFEIANAYLDPAGGYQGIVPEHFQTGPLDKYFLGQSNFGRGRNYLLGCKCGEMGCWPLEAIVEEGNNCVVWHKFSQPHRPSRDYSSFGPFEFPREQYRQAIANREPGKKLAQSFATV